MDKFIAKYQENGITRIVSFDKSKYDKDKATTLLNSKGIQNFMFFFEPIQPRAIGDNGMLFSGVVGFDIAFNQVMEHIEAGKDIILDTPGGNSWEALKIHDGIKGLGLTPSIGVLGLCASAGMQILLSTPNRWMTPNSKGLIHNPWTFEEGDDEIMRETARNLEREKMTIAEIYAKESGKKIEEILDIMKKERLLNASEMIDLNFVKSTKWNNLESEIEIVTNNEEIEMDKEDKQKLGTIEKGINSLKALLFPPKNIVLQDVNGVELDFGSEIETKEQVQVGSTATANGEPADGEYVMVDGTVYVFVSGELTEIKEPEQEVNEEVEALQEEVANLEASNADLQNKLKESQTKVANLESDKLKVSEAFNQVKAEFDEFKNKFSDEKPEINTPEPEKNGEVKKKFSYKRKNK
jgi:ATP-dependent protease ClpP protease subunit